MANRVTDHGVLHHGSTVTLSNEIRRKLGIPLSASHFAFAYPVSDAESISVSEDAALDPRVRRSDPNTR